MRWESWREGELVGGDWVSGEESGGKGGARAAQISVECVTSLLPGSPRSR